jgi:hypothetical protein
VRELRNSFEGTPILVGCKSDSEQKRQISKKEAEVIIVELR